MMIFVKNQKMPLIIIALSMMGLGAAEASSSFDSYANISFSIDSVISSDGIGSDLLLDGSYLWAEDYSSIYIHPEAVGASVVSNNPSIEALNVPISGAIGTIFEHTFATNGAVSYGPLLEPAVDVNQVGWYDLAFRNESNSVSYTINLSLNYLLSASVSGESAASSVYLTYWDDQYEVFEDVSSDASILLSLPTDNKIASQTFSFTLDPNSSRIISANVNITGGLEASPVPLPATAWMFLSGLLGVFGVKKRRITMA